VEEDSILSSVLETRERGYRVSDKCKWFERGGDYIRRVNAPLAHHPDSPPHLLNELLINFTFFLLGDFAGDGRTQGRGRRCSEQISSWPLILLHSPIISFPIPVFLGFLSHHKVKIKVMGFGSTATLAVIKIVVFVYDVVTLPIYAILQAPWSRKRDNKETKVWKPDIPNANLKM